MLLQSFAFALVFNIFSLVFFSTLYLLCSRSLTMIICNISLLRCAYKTQLVFKHISMCAFVLSQHNVIHCLYHVKQINLIVFTSFNKNINKTYFCFVKMILCVKSTCFILIFFLPIFLGCVINFSYAKQNQKRSKQNEATKTHSKWLKREIQFLRMFEYGLSNPITKGCLI